ncbi:MAG: GTPase Era [Legionellales bacterium]|nr:GTPase Era [Legionellales bacterium]
MTNYCGYIALVGRPNVGKSTLLNQILDHKISITSRKPQTTRHSILGLRTDGPYQYVYVDTPGIHLGSKKIMNKMMNKTAIRVLNDVDVIVFVIDGMIWREEDDYVLSLIQSSQIPCILVVNKVDKIADKQTLLPWLQQLAQRHDFAAIIPIAARTGLQIPDLHAKLQTFLPESPHLFPDDQLTDRSLKFLCSELVREKIFRHCGQELPYATTVEIESYKDTPKMVRISALIWVDRETHKRMIIGEKGEKLKEIATQARLDMEKLLEKKVFLQCWCKVKTGWSDNERILQSLGYE